MSIVAKNQKEILRRLANAHIELSSLTHTEAFIMESNANERATIRAILTLTESLIKSREIDVAQWEGNHNNG